MLIDTTYLSMISKLLLLVSRFLDCANNGIFGDRQATGKCKGRFFSLVLRNLKYYLSHTFRWQYFVDRDLMFYDIRQLSYYTTHSYYKRTVSRSSSTKML